MDVDERISSDSEGHVTIAGTDLKVASLLALLGAGESEASLLAKYPDLNHDDILACLGYGSYAVKEYGGRAYMERAGMVPAGRIAIDPNIVFGKPRVQGTRIAVEFLMDLLTADATEEYLLDAYPHINREDILACISYSGRIVDNLKRFPVAV
jgi:uncharacterized protein (DUF433 family)